MCLGHYTLDRAHLVCLQLCAMHELDGHRFCRYHELGQYVFGPTLGIWVVLPCQLIMMIGLGIVYSVTGGRSMQRSEHPSRTLRACCSSSATLC